MNKISRLVEVIPALPISVNRLTYFTRIAPNVGQIIEVKISGKSTPAIVARITQARENKQEIRRSTIQFKSINQSTFSELFLPIKLITAIDNTALVCGNYSSNILNIVLPRLALLKDISPVNYYKKNSSKFSEEILEGDVINRAKAIMNITAKAGKSKRVAIVLPNIESVNMYSKLLSKMGHTVAKLHSRLDSKSISFNLKLFDETGVVVLTPQFLIFVAWELYSIL